MDDRRWAIYHGAVRGRYIVREWEGEGAKLWALLGPDYTRETAQVLADALERDEVIT